MARTYSNTPVISKIKIGDTNNWLKDADARALLDSIDSSIWTELLAGFGTIGTAGDEDKLVKASDIKNYVDAIAEAALEVVVLNSLPTADASAWTTYHNAIVLVPKASAQTNNAKDEYVIMRSGDPSAYVYAWEKIGDTEIDLSGYLTDVSYVNQTLKQTKGGQTTDVHAFGDFADADQGEADLSGYVTSVSAKVTAAGALTQDANGTQIAGTVSKPAITVTPTSGSITIIDSVGSLPSFSEGAFTPNVPTALDLSKFSGGSKAADAFSANVPTSLDLSKFNGGSKAADQFTAATLTTVSKALYKQGMKAEIGTGADAETLIISNVEKEADIDVVSSFSGGSFTEGSFTPASLATGFYAAGSAATFTEGAFTPASLATGFYVAGSAASKVADSWDAGAVPTTKTQSVLASVAAELAEAPAFTGEKYAFVGSEVNATVTTVGGATVTVNPKASA